jgi:hypothetical protein
LAKIAKNSDRNIDPLVLRQLDFQETLTADRLAPMTPDLAAIPIVTIRCVLDQFADLEHGNENDS